MVVVILEVEYDAQSEREARLRALRDAETLIQQDDVLAVSADVKRGLPITEKYLSLDEHIDSVVDRVNEYVPGQMSVDECIEDALRERS